MGLSASEFDLRSRGVTLRFFHNEALESRATKLAFGIPYETLLGLLCYGAENPGIALEFFVNLSRDYPDETEAYLCCFLDRITAELDLGSDQLKVKPQFTNTPMDFPRPSPAGIIVRNFVQHLSECPELSAVATRYAVA